MRSSRLGRVALVLAALTLVGAAVPSSAGSRSTFKADKQRYEISEQITISYVNRTDYDVRMSKTWRIGEWQTDHQVAFYQWPDAERTVTPGEERTWTWHQLGPACYGECQNVWQGEQVSAGRYGVIASFDRRQVHDVFSIGRYFTLGFEGNEDAFFVVYVAQQPEIDQMNAEAEAEDKTLIVSGIVRKSEPYNPEWSYVMGSRSIVLGEAFIEVCDGAPEYVEEHRDEWLGQRWCPWSSYVARAGR